MLCLLALLLAAPSSPVATSAPVTTAPTSTPDPAPPPTPPASPPAPPRKTSDGALVCVAAPCQWDAKPGKPLICKPLRKGMPLCPPGYTFDNAEWSVPDKNLVFVWGACCPARPATPPK